MEQSLEDEIEIMREAMMGVAGKEGLTAKETMEFSRKLDNLINEYETFKENCKIE